MGLLYDPISAPINKKLIYNLTQLCFISLQLFLDFCTTGRFTLSNILSFPYKPISQAYFLYSILVTNWKNKLKYQIHVVFLVVTFSSKIKLELETGNTLLKNCFSLHTFESGTQIQHDKRIEFYPMIEQVSFEVDIYNFVVFTSDQKHICQLKYTH